MARTPVEGTGQGPDNAEPIALKISDAGSVRLPEGVNPGDLALTREGQDLVMTAPNGEIFVIEGYFTMPDAPLIMGANGSLLSPALVQSFITSLGEIESAAGPQDSAALNPVGEVTEVTGEAMVTHADGSKEKITNGTQIFEGDVVETDAAGAVNIQFADESTFAVSQNARLAVDDFSFNPDDQSGSTGLSILRGVFMFTSGLVGRENPDAVHLNTPVGSIGIRGTIIGGEIGADGTSQISVIEGAIVVRNGMGEQILSSQFETVQLSGYNAPITNIGTLNAGQMTQSYGAVRSVSAALFTSIDDTARDHDQPSRQQQQPQGENQQQVPQGEQPQDQPHAQGESHAQPVMADTPVFQALNTGSNLSTGPSSTPTHAPAPAPAPAQAPAAGAAPAPSPATAPAVTQPATSADTLPPPPAGSSDNRVPAAVKFTTGLSYSSVNEDTTSAVIGTVIQSESRPYEVHYSLASNPGGIFAINAITGEITVAAKTGDYDTGARFHDIDVRVTRIGGDGGHTDTTLRINLNPVDEAPVFNTGLEPIDGLDEGYGNLVQLTSDHIGAADPEGGSVTYVFSGMSGGTITDSAGGTWTGPVTSVDIANGAIYFRHDGSEPSAATGFVLTVLDGTGYSTSQFFHVDVTQTNDAPTTPVLSVLATIPETTDSGLTDLGTFTIDDMDGPLDGPYGFSVQTRSGASPFMDDGRFTVERVGTSNTYKLQLKAGQSLDFETEDGLSLQVVIHDGANSVISTVATLNLADMADDIVLNDDIKFDTDNNIDLLISGHKGAAVAILDVEGLSTAPNYTYTVKKGGLDLSGLFEIGTITDDHNVTQSVLRLAAGVTPAIFAGVPYNIANNDALTVTVTVGGKTETFSAVYRKDVMLLEAVSGKDGFFIENDHNVSNTNGVGIRFGASLAAGDLDGDGTNDLLFSNRVTNSGQNAGFYAFMNTGNFTNNTTGIGNGDILLSNVNGALPGYSLENSGAPNQYYASHIAYLRNFDSRSSSQGGDFAVTAPNISDYTKGSVEIRSGLTNTIIMKVTDIPTGSASGYATGDQLLDAISVTSIGDINGDGLSDLLIGSQYSGSFNAGTAGVLWGGTTADMSYGSLSAIAAGTSDGANYGASATALGDINGDHYADYAVTSPGNGKVFVYFGGPTVNPTPLVVKDAGDINLQVQYAGDFNGDGLNDIMFRSNTPGGGMITVLQGNTDLSSIGSEKDINTLGTGFNGLNIVWNGGGINPVLGDAFSSAGDFNGDGLDDIAIDVRTGTTGDFDHTLYIVYGSNAGGTVSLDQFMTNTAMWDKAYKIKLLEAHGDHITLAAAGDINGDGFDDLLIGNPTASQDGMSSHMDGEAYVVYGGNYNDAATATGAAKTTSAINKAYIGDAGSNTLTVAGHTGTTFNGGAGDDTMYLQGTSASSDTALNMIRDYDGGMGKDTLRLFFSNNGTANDTSGTFEKSIIDLRGLGERASGIEVLEFKTGSYDDTMILDIKDILTLMSSAQGNKLYIMAEEGGVTGTAQNDLKIMKDSTNSSLQSLGFSYTSSEIVHGSSETAAVYTHNATGFQLVIDNRISNAADILTMAG